MIIKNGLVFDESGQFVKRDLVIDSNHKIADTISNETNAKTMLFHSCHNVTKSEIEEGINYIDIMWENTRVLREALN